MSKKSKLIAIGSDKQFIGRSQTLAQAYDIELRLLDKADFLAEDESIGAEAQFVILSAADAGNDNDISARCQVVKYGAPRAILIVIAEKKLKPETAQFIKKSGGEIVLLENEFLENTKIDFILSQHMHGAFVPIKSTGLKQDSVLPFTIHHLLPLNKKIIPIFSPGQVLDAARLKKLNDIGEFYIKNTDVDIYNEFLEANIDQSAQGLLGRCRAKYMNLAFTYKRLVLNLTDQSEAASFKQGRELYEKLLHLSSDLIDNLGAAGEAWDVVDNASFEEFTAIDRAPAISAYAGLLSLMSGIGKPEEVMVAALMADIGLLDLPPKALPLWKENRIQEMSEGDRQIYYNHPKASINKCLAQKLPIPDDVKAVVINTHERTDMKGFPSRPQPEKIPLEAMLIQFCEMIHLSVKIEFGKARRSPIEVRKEVFDREMQQAKAFSVEFISKLAPLVK